MTYILIFKLHLTLYETNITWYCPWNVILKYYGTHFKCKSNIYLFASITEGGDGTAELHRVTLSSRA